MQLLELWQTALAPEVALQLSGTKQQNSGQVGGHVQRGCSQPLPVQARLGFFRRANAATCLTGAAGVSAITHSTPHCCQSALQTNKLNAAPVVVPDNRAGQHTERHGILCMSLSIPSALNKLMKPLQHRPVLVSARQRQSLTRGLWH